MKKIFVLLIAISLIGFISCEKTDSDSPGEIQGMGNTPGRLQIEEPFVLPEGIHLVGEISGLENPVSKVGEMKSVYDSKSVISCYGSGKYVRLKLSLLNSRNYPRTVFFPKGLLWECHNGNFQHAMQMQTSWVCLQPNSSRTILVDLYCVNLGIPAPDQTGTYKILGVTSSRIMWNLLRIIRHRKINYEMIMGNTLPGKGTEEAPTYEEITERLQTMVWNLTNNGINITEQDIAFIESIPELAPDEIPVVDENSQYPEYFDEFKVLDK